MHFRRHAIDVTVIMSRMYLRGKQHVDRETQEGQPTREPNAMGVVVAGQDEGHNSGEAYRENRAERRCEGEDPTGPDYPKPFAFHSTCRTVDAESGSFADIVDPIDDEGESLGSDRCYYLYDAQKKEAYHGSRQHTIGLIVVMLVPAVGRVVVI